MPEGGGKLYIVATPIGNLEDITYRAIRVLSEVDIIFAEDTRVTKKLLDHYDIHTRMQSYHAQSSTADMEKIISLLYEGKQLALVSDAGTPSISDPGVRLIAELREKEAAIDIIPIPGASALITALSASGFSGNQFAFYGFLPHKKGREKLFAEMNNDPRIIICYESPHRIMKTLASLKEILPSDRRLCVARELTKIYEDFIHGSAEELYVYFKEHPDECRGEFVLLVSSL